MRGVEAFVGAVQLIPHELLWSTAALDRPKISPDGRMLAFLETRDGVANLVVMPIGGDRRQVTQHTSGHGCEDFVWAGDSRHLVVSHDSGGDEDYQLDRIDVTTGESAELVAKPGVRALILGTDVRQPGVVALALNIDDPAWHDAYLADVTTGELRKVAGNPGFSRWIVDSTLAPRAGVRPLDDGSAQLQVRGADGEWATVLEVGPDDAFPLMFDVFPARANADGSAVYACCSVDADTTGLLRIAIPSGERSYVAQRPGADILDVVFDDRGEPVYAGFPAARQEYVACSPVGATDVEQLSGALDGDWAILSTDAEQRWATVRETRDAGSPMFHLYDRTERQVTPLFAADPELDRHPLAPMEPFTVTARDGLELHGYLTFPPGGPRTGLPTVLMIHGGPANRYFWGYHPQVQFLANRGYLVAQINYRGSIGYGKRFMSAGDRQWARDMHADIVDTVHWLAGSGHADRERIGLWGTSYGGYECLVAVTHDPDLVRCAVPLVAPVNLVSLLQTVPPYWRAERAYFTRVLGEDEADLWDRSPLRLADRIKVPLLLFYGACDPRVKTSEAEQLAAALAANGIAHELHVLDGEGHNLALQMTPDNRALYVERLERFLAEHLGGSSA